jgi:hypothetical protein
MKKQDAGDLAGLVAGDAHPHLLLWSKSTVHVNVFHPSFK